MSGVSLETSDALLFYLQHRRCALPARRVLEVVPACTVVPVPGAPAVVEGLIDLRGTPIAVMDVRARLGALPREPRVSDHFVVVEAMGRTLALRVDRADQLVRIDRELLVSTSDFHLDSTHVEGAARLPDGLVLIHDLDTFLSSAEQAQLARALHEHGA